MQTPADVATWLLCRIALSRSLRRLPGLHPRAVRLAQSLLAGRLQLDQGPGATLLPRRPDEPAAWIRDFVHCPLLSVLVPVYDPPVDVLRACLDSVRAQVYRRWQLCLVDDGSSKPEIVALLQEVAEADPRIELRRLDENRGITAAINEAASFARGLYCGVLDHDDKLSPWALFEFVRAINRRPRADLIYCDEAKIDELGEHVDSWHKPGWNPDLSLSFNYVMHFALYRRSLWESLGGVRSRCEGSQDYDLLLRATEEPRTIRHIPKILYSWRLGEDSIADAPSHKPWVFEAGIRVLEDALARRGVDGSVEHAPDAWPGVYRVRRKFDSDRPVTAIIAAQEDLESLLRLIGSLVKHVGPGQLEVVVCACPGLGSEEGRVRAAFPGALTWIHSPGGSSFPAAINRGVARSGRELLLLLDERMELTSREGFEALLEHIQRDEVGAVGGKVLYENGLLEHAGVVLGPFGVCGYSHRATADGPGYAGINNMIGNFSAVMGRGMMTRRSLFEALGGFDQGLARAYSDVDYCLKLTARGRLITYTPYSQMIHHIPVTPLESMVVEPEATRLRERWPHQIEHDPFFNPNFSREREDFRLHG